MSDEQDNENPEETSGPEGTEENAATEGSDAPTEGEDLASEVAAGVDEASSEDQAVADEWAAAMEEEEVSSDDAAVADEWGAAMAEEEDTVQQATLDPVTDDSQPVTDDVTPELDVILDIPVSISMEVGRTDIPIRNLLQLNQGSVVELDRLAGEPLDVLVNGTLIAHGEVVMVNDKFGIRLTDVVSQSERIQRLR